MPRTTDALITAATARVARPAADGLLSDTEFLARLDEELRTDLASWIIKARSEYWLAESTTTVTASTSDYRLPDRCLGMGLRDVTLYETANTSNRYELEQVGAADQLLWGASSALPSHFCLLDGKVRLLPTPTVSGYTLKFTFYRAPPELIATSGASEITSAPSTSGVNLDSSPTPPSTVTTTGALIDIVRGAGMYEVLFERTVTEYNIQPNFLGLTPTIDDTEIATSTVTNQRIDYVCPRGRTVYPPLPDSFWPALVALGTRVYCESIGDSRGFEIANLIYEKKVAAALGMVVPRVDGEPKKIISRSTPLRRGGILAGRIPGSTT